MEWRAVIGLVVWPFSNLTPSCQHSFASQDVGDQWIRGCTSTEFCQVRSCTFPVSWRVAAHPEISPTSHQDTFESPAMLTQAGYTPSSAYNILAVRSDECRGQSWDKGSGCTSLTLVLAARPAGLSRPLSMLSLEFFISRAVHHLSGFFKNDFWARTVSHAAFHQSGIRHTFLALSAVLG